MSNVYYREMTFGSVYYNLVFVISIMLLSIYIYLWNKRFDVKLTIIYVLTSISCLGYVFFDKAENLREAIIANKIIYLGGCFMQYAILIYILEVCTIKVHKLLKILAFFVCIMIYLSILSIGYAPIYYKNMSLEFVDGRKQFVKEYGFMHTVFYVMIFSYFLIGIVAIVYSYCKKKQMSKIMLALMVVPYITSIIGYIVGSRNKNLVELTPIGYLMFEIIYLFISNRMVLYDVDDTVIESMVQNGDTGFISFDYGYRYLGSNSVAKKIFPKLNEMTIDSPVSSESSGGRKLLHWMASYSLDKANEYVYEVNGDDEENRKIYNVTVGDLYDGRRKRGYTITFADDTEKRKYIELLDDYNSKLEREVEIKAKQIEEALEEKKKTETELELAADIQSAVLPNVFPAFPDRKEIDIYAIMDPAKEVGGDFYDYFFIDDDHLCVLIADVSGKGIPASLFMMTSKTTIANCARHELSPAKILMKANDAICATNKMDMFVTVWLGVLEISTGKLTASSAGHEYPFICHNGKFEVYMDKHGMAAGVMDGLKYREYEINLSPGDSILVYTDGVAEANDTSRKQFGLERIEEALDSGGNKDCKSMVLNIKEKIDEFTQGADQFDDITMVAVKYNGVN